MTDYEESDDIRVDVTDVRYDGGTTAIGIGIDIMTGEVIRFGGDWRMMMAISEALTGPETPRASVPPWAVLSRV